MSNLLDTSLLIQMSRIPPDFHGGPQDLADLMVSQMRVVSPVGTNFFVVGDVEPSSNVGPWLKSGREWWTWSESVKRYAPQDITSSEKNWFWAGTAVPASTPPLLWLLTSEQGQAVGWKYFNTTRSEWEFFSGPVLAGPTANRPTGAVEYQQYFDTDIGVLIWFERLQWRTVAGVPGDVKAVAFATLREALETNPGWSYFGQDQQDYRGRIVVQAVKDPGAAPENSFSPPPGVAARSAFETFGETDQIAISTNSGVPVPPQIALWHLVKG